MNESLCGECIHVQTIQNARGSNFYLCNLAKTQIQFNKYPRQPVRQCVGFQISQNEFSHNPSK